MTNERRQKRRTKIRGIHYLQIEPNNGGLVLDISEGGLSFQAAAPVLNVGAVHFSFSSHLKGQVEAEGEVAWKSVNRKVVGLRFTRMTPEAWECVRELLGSNLENKAEVEATPTFAKGVNAKPQPLGSSWPEAPVESQWQRVQRSNSPAPEAELPEMSFLLPSSDSLENEWKAARRQGFFRGLVVGIVTSALAVSSVWAYIAHDGQIPNLFADLQARMERTLSSPTAQGQTEMGSTTAQAPGGPAAAVSLPDVASKGADANAPSASSLTALGSADLSSPNLASDSNADASSPGEIPAFPTTSLSSSLEPASPHKISGVPAARSEVLASQVPTIMRDNGTSRPNKASGRETDMGQAEALPSEEDGQDELRAADRILRSSDNRSSYATAAQWLWAAVREGNTQAEVELSDLYLSGEGVAKNCEQARILLQAAASKGNAEARERLRAISFSACRS